MLNSIIIQGRIAKLNELKLTQTQKSVLSFTVACDRDFDRENTDFIPCVAWGKAADFIDKYFQKGQMILIRGRLQVREWTDDRNNRRSSTEIIVESVNFCGDKKKDEASAKKSKEPDDSQQQIEDTPEYRFQELNGDGELPF